MQLFSSEHEHGLDPLQRIATSLIAALVLLTFIGANAQALLWQSSDWLVGTVLPAVVVDLTNDERSSIAAGTLKRSETLDAAAKRKAEHMAKNGYFAHFAPDGTSPWYFFDQAGYVYAHAGENLAIHFSDSAEVVEAWMNSPTHKENIVNRNYTEIGVGTAKGTYDGYDTVFVVQLFGTPAVAPPATESLPTPVSQPAAVEIAVTDQSATQSADTSETLANLRSQLETIQQQADTLLETEVVTTVDLETVPETVADVDILATEPVEITTTEVLTATRSEVIDDVLVVETEISTSSGLAVASIVEPTFTTHSQQHAGATIASVITRPNLVVDVMYSLLISAILALLSIALFGEARRLHYMQAAYSLLLISGVGGLWFIHTVLTSGAVIL